MNDRSDPVLDYAKPTEPGSYLGHSIFALILAILGFVIFPLPVCAFWIARSVLKNPSKIESHTRSLAVAARRISFLTIPVSVLILTSVFLPSFNSRRPPGRLICSSNMRQIGLGLMMYANANNDLYPPDLVTLLKNEELTAGVFICPDSDDEIDHSTMPTKPESVVPGTPHCSYIYLPDSSLRASTVSQDRIMLIEPLKDHQDTGMNVLYADDHVDWLPAIEANRVMAELLIGHNPPTPPGVPATAPTTHPH